MPNVEFMFGWYIIRGKLFTNFPDKIIYAWDVKNKIYDTYSSIDRMEVERSVVIDSIGT